MSMAAQAESPAFITRGSGPTPPAAKPSTPATRPASLESWLNANKAPAPATRPWEEPALPVHTPATACGDACDNGGLLSNSVLFGAVNAWRGPLDGPSNNNFGFVGGFNMGVPLLRSHGIGAQFGASYGGYDFHGRDDFGPESEISSSEEQMFFSAGVFHRCTSCCEPCGSHPDRISWGVVYDYMLTDNTSAAAAELNLGQIRGQIGYAINCANEIGIQGAMSDGTDDDFEALGFRHTTRSIDQVSGFWHHVCCCSGLETRVYAGWAEDLGDWLIGANATMPINDCWSLFGGFTYIAPSSAGGDDGSREEFWNVTAGVAFYPGGNARTNSVCGHRWMPLLPVADNGSFALDLGF
jgi:hypothetical protein